MDTRRLDPRQYRMEHSSLDEITFRALREACHPSLAHLGRELGRMGVLPLMEEPRGSERVVTSGNFSIKDVSTGGFFITGSGVDKEHLAPEAVLYVESIDYEQGIIFASGEQRPSREVLIHDAIYRAFPGTNVVVHTHDEKSLTYLGGGCPSTPNPIFFANQKEADIVVASFQRKDYVTLPEHGQFTKAATLEEALQTVRRYNQKSQVMKGAYVSLEIVEAGVAALFCTAFIQGLFGNQKSPYFEDCQVDASFPGIVEYVCPTERFCPDSDWGGSLLFPKDAMTPKCVYIGPATP